MVLAGGLAPGSRCNACKHDAVRMACDVERPVAKSRISAAILTHFTTLGTPQTERRGGTCSTEREPWPHADRHISAVKAAYDTLRPRWMHEVNS